MITHICHVLYQLKGIKSLNKPDHGEVLGKKYLVLDIILALQQNMTKGKIQFYFEMDICLIVV